MEGPRRPRPSELDDLADLIWHALDYFREHSSVDRLRREVRERTRMRHTRVIVEEGRPVSHLRYVYDHLSIFGCRVKVGSVSSVCTHPDYRGRGYAGALLAQSFAEMRDRGARVVIVSGDRGLYRRAHCVPAGHLLTGRVGRDSVPAGPTSLTVRRGGPDDWPALARLHSAEPVRFVRTADGFARLCAQWVGSPPELWLVEAQAVPVAYLWLGPLWSRPRAPARDICEYAGSRAALVEAVPLIFEATGLQEIGVSVLGHDRELAYLLSQRGAVLKANTIEGTHGMLNLPGLIRDLRPYVAALLPLSARRRLAFDQRGEGCSFRFREERLNLDLSRTVRLVLGSPETPPVGGEIGRLLWTIFPLPLPMPGFNAV